MSVDGLLECLMANELLRFEYVNWRGDEHSYVIDPESKPVEYGPYDAGGGSPDGPCRWVLHGMVVTRDGDVRPEMITRRRTFLIEGLRNVETVRRSR